MRCHLFIFYGLCFSYLTDKLFPCNNLLQRLEYFISHIGGVFSADAKAATNWVSPLLSTLELARRHSKLYHLLPKNYFRQNV